MTRWGRREQGVRSSLNAFVARASGRHRSALVAAALVGCLALACSGKTSNEPESGEHTAASGATSIGGTSNASAGTMNGSAGAIIATGGDNAGTGGSAGTGGNAGAGGSDVSSLFYPNGGPTACPTLAQNSCWQRMLQEYVNIETCFSDRTRCSVTGDGGDASQCGIWRDPSHDLCQWSDGAQIRVDPATQTETVMSRSGAECYQKQFTTIDGAAALVVTFGTRSYTITVDAGTGGATYVCPDGTRATATAADFQACNLRGICCAEQQPTTCHDSASL